MTDSNIFQLNPNISSFGFKTIDEWLDHCIDVLGDRHTLEQDIITYIVNSHPQSVLNLLKSNDGNPSKHDLRIINAVISLKRTSPELTKQVLQVYKNRK